MFNHHPDLTILARDQRSYELAQNEFRARSALCPDMAFVLGMLDRPALVGGRIVWLARSDIEACRRPRFRLSPDIEQLDWVKDDVSALFRLTSAALSKRCRQLGMFDQLVPIGTRALALCGVYDWLAGRQVARGCRILRRGRVVITDRLHGHILSILLRIPHVLLDNCYGKLRSFYDTWTRGCESTAWAEDGERALQQARALAR
jgi:exopolysaccharide biosynthesis predicted pyruvyltransferase EpsI